MLQRKVKSQETHKLYKFLFCTSFNPMEFRSNMKSNCLADSPIWQKAENKINSTQILVCTLFYVSLFFFLSHLTLSSVRLSELFSEPSENNFVKDCSAHL